MSAASTPHLTKTAQPAKKGVRRSPANWSGSAPHRTARRTAEANDRPVIVRFPTKPDETAIQTESRENRQAQRLQRIQESWSPAERERRRLLAIERQQELAALLACCELEDNLRCAVAYAEYPVTLPEIDVLRR
jgi:hypothetical protein